MISDLVDYLNNNLLIVHYCGFDISMPLPSYWTFDRFLSVTKCIIPLNKMNTKNPKLLPQGNPVCEASLVMWKDGTFSDRGRTHQKFCCPLKNSTDADCPCHHKNFYNRKKQRGLPDAFCFHCISMA